MHNRFKEITLKALLVLEMILLLVLFPGMIFISFVTSSQETFNTIFYTVLILILLVGMSFIILCFMFGGIKSKPTQAEKLALTFNDFDAFEKFLDVSLGFNGYKRITDLYCKKSNIHMQAYVKKRKYKEFDCFFIIKVEELLIGDIEIINDSISNVLSEFLGDCKITDTINTISVFCVDRITPTFKNLVNNVQQGLKNGRLPVGVSMGGKRIYISKQNDGFAIRKYKRLRKEFLNIINFKSNNTGDSNTGDGSMC